MTSKELVAQMTLEEKASLCSGRDFWYLKGVDRLGLSPIMVTDGPHGLRKQAEKADHLGVNQSVPATCFPTASATACAFDPELMYDIGAALGEECQQEEVAVILGPGANAKRSPLCGRNFEYISEDPYVTGETAAALIRGVQSQGIGVSIKHYAANNQETRRMTGDSVVDERALREIYLTGFETAVKKAQPWTVMCSYNKLDGVYLSENKRLLSDILRDEWGFEGLVMTDWGAASDRVAGVKAGLDLEMPSSGGMNDARIVQAVREGRLAEADLDKIVVRLADLILKTQEQKKADYRYDAEAHQDLARRAARESAVLLQNTDAILPLRAEQSVAVIGAFAKTPRYQGAGSSKINPSRMENAFDALEALGLQMEYAEGYPLKDVQSADLDGMCTEACRAAEGKDAVLLFAGLPDAYESEGFDRTTLAMPEYHNRLIEAVAAVNPNVVVVLLCGAPVVMPWLAKVKGVLLAYLGGQAGGGALAELLLGKASPSGKLAESFPLALEDNPSYHYFPGAKKTVEYRESIFVGYRYYDAVKKQVQFPFGYGLSYTSFAYSDLQLGAAQFQPGETLSLSFTVTNTGSCAGAEIAQVYVGLAESKLFRAEKELKGFRKVFLEPGESKTVTLELNTRSFAYYNPAAKDWAVEGGTYCIQVGASSRDIHLTAELTVAGDGKEALLAETYAKTPIYYQLPAGTLEVPDAQFAALLDRPIPPGERQKGEPHTVNSTLDDVRDTLIGKQLLKIVQEKAGEMLGDQNEDITAMAEAMMMDMPLRSLVMLSQGAFTLDQLESLVAMLNGNILKGMGGFLKKKK